MDDRPQGTQSVKLAVEKYSWKCPTCGTTNEGEGYYEIVTCEKCRTSFGTIPLKPDGVCSND